MPFLKVKKAWIKENRGKDIKNCQREAKKKKAR